MQLDTILSVNDLWVNYGTKIAVESVSYDVQEGDLVGVVGANGSGKSSMFKAILGLLPHRGTVSLFGRPFHRDLLRSVGYVPQKISFEPMFPATVFDVVAMALTRATLTPTDRRHGIVDSDMSNSEKVMKCLNTVRMWGLRHRRIGALSGGELQRVFIAQSLVRNPSLLIMDEPAVSLDVKSQKLFYSIMQEANSEYGITMIVSLHNMDVVKEYSNKVVCMNRTLAFHGKTSDFFADEKLLGLCTEYKLQDRPHPHEHSHEA